MQYRRLRAPREHGATLELPPLNRVESTWRSNLDHLQTMGQIRIGDVDLASLQESGRKEVVELARRYTRDYLDVDFSGRASGRIVMSGHQPELFHPGVWFKNFALSKIGQQLDCVAINLVVDNDICGSPAIRYPSIDSATKSVSVGTIRLDSPGANVPFENRRIEDPDFFASFPDRVASAISPLVKSPLANLVWEQLEIAKSQNQSQVLLGQTIAQGRHRVESKFGLATLEVPVSQIASTDSFAVFAKSILTDIHSFQSSYNSAIAEYRKIHKIRSNAHPVPELIGDGDWLESPFWVWHHDRPQRRRLFVKPSGSGISLTDRDGWQADLEPNNFVSQFRDLFGTLATERVAIRPRALVTTMFCRMVLSDIFIHGIGGAKYDQLTDSIASQFFGAAPPEFMTISATMKIKNDFELPDRADLIAMRQLRREVEFHPETLIHDITPQAQAIIQSKQNWISGTNASSGDAKARHEAIREANELLQPFTNPSFAELSEKIAATAGELRKSAVLNSREYSFALFDESLVGELGEIAAKI